MYDPLCGILYNGWLIKAVVYTILSGILYKLRIFKMAECVHYRKWLFS